MQEIGYLGHNLNMVHDKGIEEPKIATNFHEKKRIGRSEAKTLTVYITRVTTSYCLHCTFILHDVYSRVIILLRCSAHGAYY